MAQLLKKVILTTAVAAGFANLSPAAEPLQSDPVEIIKVSTKYEGPDEDTKAAVALTCLTVLSALGAYALTRNRSRSMFGDDDD